MSLQLYLDTNFVTLAAPVVTIFDTLGANLMTTAVASAPSPPGPLSLEPLAVAMSSPHEPSDSSIQFLAMLSADITSMILIPLTAGAAGLMLVPPVVVPPPPVISPSATILIPMTPPYPNLAKAFMQWAASFVPSADLRAPGGFIVS